MTATDTKSTRNHHDSRLTSFLRPYAALVQATTGLAALTVEWQRRTVERDHLKNLDVRLLDDVGLSAEDRDRETDKPFWRR